MAANWFLLGWTAIAACFFRFLVIPLEERHLVGRFGDRYREYQGRTGMLVPIRL